MATGDVTGRLRIVRPPALSEAEVERASILAVLDEAAELVRSGDLASIALAGVAEDGGIVTVYQHNERWVPMVAAVSTLQARLLREAE